MKIKPFRRMLSVLLVFALFVTLLPPIQGKEAEAAGDVREISNFNDLVAEAAYSRTAVGSAADYVLTADIEITDEDYKLIENDPVPYISFGSGDTPFSGTFDGQGHTITGLKYIEVATKPLADTGLFSQTNGATIKNLTLVDAEIESDMRGGIVAGYAENTTIENVNVEQSSLSVAAADNVLLIGTDLGIRGGGIAGETVNSVLYNCEVKNCFIRSNNTSGVAALAGKPLTLGGIVGCAESSTIEYCRVIGDKPYDENAEAGKEKTRISIYYDVVVGAVGGNTLYVGGIAGRIWAGDNDDANEGKPTKIIDCFSTADLYYYCATYVSVLGVNIGHIGGITAEVWDGNCEITRSHYAGTASSRQWNSLLVIPIIQNNVNISGVADLYGGNASQANSGKIYGAFFKDSLNPDVAMDTLDGISSNGNYGPWSDSLYTTRSAWETFDYDFTGTTDRTSDYNGGAAHHNKWVMDYELGIPVHGTSVAATLDFPGAGKVSIASTDLVGQEVSTTDPYTFAVQGTASSDNSLTLTYEKTDAGYRLDGWWRIPDVTDDTSVHEHSYFERLFENYKSIPDVPVYGEEGLQTVENPVSKQDVYIPENEIGEVTAWQDNDLFVARIEAEVAFHDYQKNLIDTDGAPQNGTTDNDWYYYEETLPEVVPDNAPESENAVFIGWTTDDSKEYTAITSAELETLKNNGEFYETGDIITKPMELYPVYSDLISNVNTIFEGHEQDAQDNVSLRDGVGNTASRMNDDKTITISVTGAGTDGTFPDGYRFLGWYDEDGYCVSREQEYTLAGIDLTQKHTYTARFEYRVDYMVKRVAGSNSSASDYDDGKLYTSVWHKYEEPVQQIPGLNFVLEYFEYWCTDGYQGADRVTENTLVVSAPFPVYSHNRLEDSNLDRDVDLLNDFPGSGTITIEYDWGSQTSAEITSVPETGFQFVGWSFENRDNSREPYNSYGTQNPRDTTTLSIYGLVYWGHFVAELNFYDKDQNLINDAAQPVTRRYEQPVFDSAGNYTYPYYLKEVGDRLGMTGLTHTYAGAPTDQDMKKDGYYFIGWVDKNSLTGDEWEYIFDVENDSCCTSSIEKVKPYILSEDAKVYAPMELYPVYAKYDYIFTTNLEEIGFTGNETVNAPNLPEEVQGTFTESGDGYAEVTFTVDTATPVEVGTSEPLYTVVSVEAINQTTGEREVLIANADGSYTGTIEAGYQYKFIANYEPIAVIYHTGGTTPGEDILEPVIRNAGDRLGEAPDPVNTQEIVGEDYVFAGWTLAEPEQGIFYRVEYDNIPALASENTAVTGPMELWPVYAKVSVNVNSNIDSAAGVVPDAIRGFRVNDLNQQGVQLWAAQSVAADPDNYAFVGWYTGYQSDADKGTLVSSNRKTELSGTDVFAGTTYTAVYEKVYRLNYHDTEGNIIYTAYASQSNPRSFVQTQTITKPDGEGGTISEEVTSIIDTEAFALITEAVPANEQFLEWQWVQADGATKRWDEFYNETITQNMELYPVTNAVDVEDTNGNELSYVDENSPDRDISLGLRQDEETKESVISVLLRTEYMQPYIEVIVSEKAYNETGTPNVEEIAGQKVTLYVAHSAPASDGSVADVSLCDTKVTEQQTGSSEILAHFELYGQLTLTKKMAEGSAADEGEVFLFKVTVGSDVQTIPLVADQSVVMTDIPYGTAYMVTEDENWSWRYDGTTEGTANGTISNYTENGEVTFVNRKTNENWFGGSEYISNEFDSNGGNAGN